MQIELNCSLVASQAFVYSFFWIGGKRKFITKDRISEFYGL
jgi:hypothetical protein